MIFTEEAASLRRVTLRSKEAKRIIRDFSEKYPWTARLIRPHGKVEALEVGNGRLLIVDGSPLILEVEDYMIPTLRFEEALKGLPTVVVDMGGCPPYLPGRGRHGSRRQVILGAFEMDGIVRVVDERYGKTLCIGVALASSSEVSRLGRGRIVKNLHYVGDDAWGVLDSIKQ
jgi:predicted ribosome-associated RNA-binding protein Tma20